MDGRWRKHNGLLKRIRAFRRARVEGHVVGFFRDRCGIVPGLCWDRSGTILGLVRGSSGEQCERDHNAELSLQCELRRGRLQCTVNGISLQTQRGRIHPRIVVA